jgi:putative membrane protein
MMMGYGYGPGWMMNGWGGYGYGYGLFHMVLPVAVIVALIFLMVWAVRSLAGAGAHGAQMRRSAGLDVLEERYARGEINRDEYLQKKRDLAG